MMRGVALILLILFAWTLQDSEACPTNRTLYQYCKCESSFNGVLLDCSGVDPYSSLQVLRDNQVQLGLVQQLIIQNTTLRELTPSLFRNLYIKKLDLSNNKIENVSNSAFEGLENILQSLVMQKNKLTELPVHALEGMAALLQLDLSNNSIGNLDGRQALRNTPKLYDLSLADNKICKIHKTIFDQVKHSIQTLNLGSNCLTKVPAAALRGFKQLLALHLHNNQLRQLEPLQFMNLPLLNLINLARNQIVSIHRQAFLNVPNLRLMYLSENNISRIEPQEFRHFEALEMLDLTKNHLKEIPNVAFANMSHLSQLYLGQNKISAIGNSAFANSSITILLLPHNQLTELRQEMFQWMSYLQQLSLKDNQIKKVARNAFYHMPSLVMLDLSGNQLTSLPPAAFLTQLNMFLVDLTRNRLITTPYNAFNKRVMTVILQENPLVCTERVHMLQNGVGVYVPGTVDRICGGVPAPAPSRPLPPQSQPGGSFPQGALQPGDRSPFVQGSAPQVPPRQPVGGQYPSDPNFKQKNTTTIYKPQITLAPGFFTRRPLIRPAGPAIPGNSVPEQFPTDLPFQPGSFPQGQNPNGQNPNISRQFGPQRPDFAVGPQQPNPFGPVQPGQPRSRPSPTIPPGESVTVPVRTHGINIGDPRNGQVDNFPRNQPGQSHGNEPNQRWRQPTINQPSVPGGQPGLNGNPNNRQVQPVTPDPKTGGERRTLLPHPVPFLKNNPLYPAARVPQPVFTTPEPTLPPFIKTAGTHRPELPKWTQPKPKPRTEPPWIPVQPDVNPSKPINPPVASWEEIFTEQPSDTGGNPTSGRRPVYPGSITDGDKTAETTRLPPSVRTVPPKTKPGGPESAVAGDFEKDKKGGAAAGSATTTIAVCLTVVVLVMIAVFITLCVVRHRNNTRRSESSASRTSAYVAAQASRLNYASNYGTASMARMNGGRPQGRPGQTWIYAPEDH